MFLHKSTVDVSKSNRTCSHDIQDLTWSSLYPPVCPPAAVLFWLNYKAAYDNWNEQRLALNKDIHMATKEVVDKLPGIQQTSAQAFSTLFLQLTVNDLGICLPITNTSQVICLALFWLSKGNIVELYNFNS